MDCNEEQKRKHATKGDLIKLAIELKAIEVAKEVARKKKEVADYNGLKIDCVERWNKRRNIRR